MIRITVDSLAQRVMTGERLIDAINRNGSKIPQVCYHPQLGPIQTCDTAPLRMPGLFDGVMSVILSGILTLLRAPHYPADPDLEEQ
jgi:predicted molibdopterin-dependent oxidoreductase YjgC